MMGLLFIRRSVSCNEHADLMVSCHGVMTMLEDELFGSTSFSGNENF